MKNPIFCLCMLAMLFFSFSLSATVLIDPAGDGGFELGATFADNGWTHVYTPPDQNQPLVPGHGSSRLQRAALRFHFQ